MKMTLDWLRLCSNLQNILKSCNTETFVKTCYMRELEDGIWLKSEDSILYFSSHF